MLRSPGDCIMSCDEVKRRVKNSHDENLCTVILAARSSASNQHKYHVHHVHFASSLPSSEYTLSPTQSTTATLPTSAFEYAWCWRWEQMRFLFRIIPTRSSRNFKKSCFLKFYFTFIESFLNRLRVFSLFLYFNDLPQSFSSLWPGISLYRKNFLKTITIKYHTLINEW